MCLLEICVCVGGIPATLASPVTERPIEAAATEAIQSSLVRVFVALVHCSRRLQVVNIKNKDIAGYLKLPPVKLHCSMLAEDAIKAAVKDYKDRYGKSTSEAEAEVKETLAAAASTSTA